MAKKKDEEKVDAVDGQGHPILDEPVDNHGPCKDCSKVVDVIVDMYQVVGKNRLICPECRIARIAAKAEKDAEKITDNATKAREAAAQGLLEFPPDGEPDDE